MRQSVSIIRLLTRLKKCCIIDKEADKEEVKIMTGKEIVNLIDVLREKDIPGDEIIRIIRYIETHEPRENEPRIKGSCESD